MTTSIWWIKRDFRLHDNEALTQALQESNHVLPVFVFEPELIAQPDYSAIHVNAWGQALGDLRKSLLNAGGNLYIAVGDVGDVLQRLYDTVGFEAIYSHEETGNHWTFQRDIAVKKWCETQKVKWTELPQNAVIRAFENRDDRQPTFRKRLIQTHPFPAPDNIPLPDEVDIPADYKDIPPYQQFFDASDCINIDFDAIQTVSETQARKDLDDFLNNRGIGYSGGISSPNSAFVCGSRLSPHLAWGTLSLRTVFTATMQAQARHKTAQWGKSLRAFSSRLHWHDHFIQRLESAPEMEFGAINPAYADIVYEDDRAKLEAWINGRTGFPLIDACMRCLAATGFMNFRMRAMVVSFAIYGLHLSWRTIHAPLARVFLDYEPGIHLSQLQMQAGVVGINTIRVYSPTKQIIDQDPDCVFIRRWVPELEKFDSSDIIASEITALGTYPRPIVDFKVTSREMKDQIFAVRKSEYGKSSSQEILRKHGSRKKVTTKKSKSQLSLF